MAEMLMALKAELYDLHMEHKKMLEKIKWVQDKLNAELEKDKAYDG